jgi:hypothetical protein
MVGVKGKDSEYYSANLRKVKGSKSKYRKDPEFDSFLVKNLSNQVKQLKHQNERLLEIISRDPVLYKSVEKELELLNQSSFDVEEDFTVNSPVLSSSGSIPIDFTRSTTTKTPKSRTFDEELLKEIEIDFKKIDLPQTCIPGTPKIVSMESGFMSERKASLQKEFKKPKVNTNTLLLPSKPSHNLPVEIPPPTVSNLEVLAGSSSSAYLHAFNTDDFKAFTICIGKSHIQPGVDCVFFFDLFRDGNLLWTVKKTLTEICAFHEKVRTL